jgi:hypothetical protein
MEWTQHAWIRPVMPVHQCTNMVKLIHGWIPYNSFLYKQRRVESALCPQCKKMKEDQAHIFKCSEMIMLGNRNTINAQLNESTASASGGLLLILLISGVESGVIRTSTKIRSRLPTQNQV